MMKYAQSVNIQGSSVGRESHWTTSRCASTLKCYKMSMTIRILCSIVKCVIYGDLSKFS